MIAGIGISKGTDGKPSGNGITGYKAATPENLATLRQTIARMQGKGNKPAITSASASASGFKI